jgi:hypothetical protein
MEAIILCITAVAVIILLSIFSNNKNTKDKPRQRQYRGGQTYRDNRRFQRRDNRRFQRYGNGRVIQLLDNQFSTDHQKFIIKTPENETLLITHNIDLAPELHNLKVGDFVEFYGECFETDRGYGIHYTHRSTSRNHASGYLRHNNRTYS